MELDEVAKELNATGVTYAAAYTVDLRGKYRVWKTLGIEKLLALGEGYKFRADDPHLMEIHGSLWAQYEEADKTQKTALKNALGFTPKEKWTRKTASQLLKSTGLKVRSRKNNDQKWLELDG